MVACGESSVSVVTVYRSIFYVNLKGFDMARNRFRLVFVLSMAVLLIVASGLWAHCGSCPGDAKAKAPAVCPASSAKPVQCSMTSAKTCSGAGSYAWKDTAGKYMDLEIGGKKALRYMYEHDLSSEDERMRTYKPFYHVFDMEGENLITKGDGGRYTHHRGIFLGWKTVTFDGKQYDFWHMKNVEPKGKKKKKNKKKVTGPVKGVDQVHVKVLDKSVCAGGASLTSQINWITADDTVVISEQRKVTVAKRKCGAVAIDVNTKLTAVNGDVALGGDPEHAGFQFRAHNDVNEAAEPDKATYLYHKAGIAKKGKKGKKGVEFANKDLENLPWVAMNYGLNGKKYTVQHMNATSVPKPYTYSSGRYYGRFGSFPKAKIKSGDTLEMSWRIIVQETEMLTREKFQKRYNCYLMGKSK